MGRFAQVLGIGVRGGVEIELPKVEFYAGEPVMGHVKLTIREQVNAEELELKLKGKEHLGWRQQQGKRVHHHHIKHILFSHEIKLVATPTVFLPGEYVYPFAFHLAPNLPGSHSAVRIKRANNIRRITSSITYNLKAQLKVRGTFKADIGGERGIGVHALPKFAPLPITPKEDTLTRPVTFLCCFNKGQCHVSGAVSTSVLDFYHGVFRVHGTVKNESTAVIDHVVVRLYENLTMHIPQGFTHGGLRHTVSRCVDEHKLPGVAPGASNDEIVADFTMQQMMAKLKPYTGNEGDFFGDALQVLQPLSLMPTTETLFVSVTYHVAIECCYAWCENVKLEMEMAIHLPPLVNPAVPVPVGAVVAPS